MKSLFHLKYNDSLKREHFFTINVWKELSKYREMELLELNNF